MSNNQPDGKSDLKVYLPFIMAIVLAAGVFIGYLVSTNTVNKPSVFANQPYSKIDNILDFAEVHYVDTLDREELEQETIDDLLSNLDPHSYYIPAKDLTGVTEDLQGNFEGIGVEFSIVEDTIMVVTPITGGPSEEVGVMAGDKIIFIDDSLVAGVGTSNADVMSMLKGPKGTEVKLGMLRSGKDEIDFTIKRDKIPLFSVDVSYLVTEDIGFIKVNRFSATTYDEFNAGIRILQEKGMKKLIVDLRGNPGGYLGAAVQMADELLDGKKLVVYTQGRAYQKQDYFAERPGYFEEGDLAILIDQNSASASEILAGAVQDWDRGILIGRRTFGKGLVQDQYTLKDESALRLTIARYYTPSGRSIQKDYADSDEYYEEVYERYDDGEMLEQDSVDVNDSTVYKTLILERPVYGGGGIYPDVFVPLDTTVVNFYVNGLRRFVPEYIYSHYSIHSGDYDQYETVASFDKNFKISASFFNDFISFAKDKEWEGNESKLPRYRATIELVLKAFLAKQKFQNEGYFTVINQMDPIVNQAIIELNKGIDLNK